MSKLFVVCPQCQAKYAVANKDIAGKSVSCKKCSQKFTAKIYVAAPAKTTVAATQTPTSAPPSDLMKAEDSDLFGDDTFSDNLFDDMPGPSSAGPTLGSLPPVKRKPASSSKKFPIVPLAAAGGGIAILAVLVMVGVSIANSASDFGPGALSDLPTTSGTSGTPTRPMPTSKPTNNGQADFQKHHEVLDKQMKLMNQFIAAMENVNSDEDLPQFVTTVDGLTADLREVARQVSQLPKVSKENNQKLSQEAERRTKEFLPRMKAAGQKMSQYNRNAEVTNAMLNFQAAGKEVSHAINSTKERFAGSPTPEKKSKAPAGNRPNGKRMTSFQRRVGFNSSVTFKTPNMNGEQGEKIKQILEPVLATTSSSQSGNGKESTLEVHYEGEINDLLPRITFGEIERVDAEDRCIYLKTLTVSTE